MEIVQPTRQQNGQDRSATNAALSILITISNLFSLRSDASATNILPIQATSTWIVALTKSPSRRSPSHPEEFQNKDHILQSLRPTNDTMDRDDVSVLVLECSGRTDDEEQHQLSASSTTAPHSVERSEPIELPLITYSAPDEEDMNQPFTNRALWLQGP